MCKLKIRNVLVSGVLALSVILVGAPTYADEVINQSEIVSSNFININNYNIDTFKDVTSNNWFQSGVKSVYELNLMSGKSNGGFDPNGNVLIGEAIAIASRVHAFYNEGTDSVIPQGSEKEWWSGYEKYARDNNIIKQNEYSGKDMQKPATREDIAYILSNALPSKELDSINKDLQFKDVTNNIKHDDAIYLMAKAGVISGYDNGQFKPTQNISRAETAVITNRLVKPSDRVKQQTTNTKGTTVYVSKIVHDQVSSDTQTVSTKPISGYEKIVVKYGTHAYNSNNQKEYDMVMEVVEGVVNGTSKGGKQAHDEIKQFKTDEKYRERNLKTSGIGRITSDRALQDELYTMSRMSARASMHYKDTTGGKIDSTVGNSAYSRLFEGKADCTADAMATMAVFDAMGYNAKTVANDSQNHEWVMVQIGGKWFEDRGPGFNTQGLTDYNRVTQPDTFNNAK